MENFHGNISIAEQKWLDLLFNYSKEKFSRAPLPSHDHLHHARVWNYAKQILKALSEAGIVYSQPEVEAIMVAVFFHDLGMTITRDKQHGIESRKLCQSFFDDHALLLPSNAELIYEMIEKHDDKEYIILLLNTEKPAAAAILNIADDLDAFGNIGVYRYTEIYYFRGIPVEELPSLVLPNLEARYLHFSKQLGQLEELVYMHRRRFEIIFNFFTSMKSELKVRNKFPGSFQKIVQLLIDFSNSGANVLQGLAIHAHNNDPVVTKFFDDLLIELDWDATIR
jgi:HD superfamily phosphodiesterase